MILSKAVLLTLVSAIAVSWGWGMRGTAIGGEKGAMLPGALSGLMCAFIISNINGYAFMKNYTLILTAVGAISMYYGGMMTYGDTLNFTMRNDKKRNAKLGYTGVFVKGALWFAICYGTIFMYIGILSGKYKLWHLILFFICLPIFSIIGFSVFNKPYNKELCIYPKFYFSSDRNEVWGILVGIVFDILLFSLNCRDNLTFLMTFCGILTGGTGWVFAELLQDKCRNPDTNGKYLFGLLNDNYGIETWKLMECTLGAIGGIGLSVFTIILVPKFGLSVSMPKNLFISANTSKILGIIYFIILIIDTMQYFITGPKTKAELTKMREYGLLSRDEYDRQIVNAPETESVKLKKYKIICEKCEHFLYAFLPTVFIFLGSVQTARLVTMGVIFLVLAQEITYKFYNEVKNKHKWEIALYTVCLALCIISVFTDRFIGYTLLMCIYTFVYEFIVIIKKYNIFIIKSATDKNAKIFGHSLSVHIYFIICCSLLMLFSVFL